MTPTVYVFDRFFYGENGPTPFCVELVPLMSLSHARKKNACHRNGLVAFT
jgi:hypothetical protein